MRYLVDTKEKAEVTLKYFATKELVAMDTEYNPATSKLHSIQIGDNTKEVVYINLELYKEVMQKFLATNSITKVFHNSKADISILADNGYSIKNTTCTMLNEMLLNAGRTEVKYSLYQLELKYLGIARENKLELQQIIGEQGITSMELFHYAADDVYTLLNIYEAQLVKLKNLKLTGKVGKTNLSLVEIEYLASYPFADIERLGIKIDEDKLRNVDKSIEDTLNALIEEINEETNKLLGFPTSINWNSPKQKLGVLQLINPEIEDTQASTLAKYTNDHTIIKKLMSYAKLSKLRSSFGLNLLKFTDNNSRVHPNIVRPILATGRISMVKPPLQTIPSNGDIAKEIRACFIAREDFMIVGADYSNIQMRLAAFLSNESYWLDEFSQLNADMHTAMAMRMFNIPKDKVKEESTIKKGVDWRSVAKQLNFTILFGAGAGKIAEFLGISKAQATDIIELYFKSAPNLKQWLDSTSKFALDNRYISCPITHRKRFFKKGHVTPLEYKDIAKQAPNSTIQGLEATIAKLGGYYLYKESQLPYWKDKVYVINFTHDEWTTEAHKTIAEEWLVRKQYLLSKASSNILRTYTIPTEGYIMPHWSK